MSQNFIERVVELTNAERQKAGLPALRLNSLLSDAAQKHSLDMAMRDYYNHSSPDGRSPWDRIKATGYQHSGAAENIFAGPSTPEAAMAGWMKSSEDRKNILNPNLQEIGVGYYFLADDRGNVNHKHYWTQLFATPTN